MPHSVPKDDKTHCKKHGGAQGGRARGGGGVGDPVVTKFASQPALYRIGLRTRSVSESAHCHLIHLAVPVTMAALHLAVPVTRCQAHRTTVTTPASPTFWLKCHAWCYVDLCWVYIGWWLNFASPPGGVTPIFAILPCVERMGPPKLS